MMSLFAHRRTTRYSDTMRADNRPPNAGVPCTAALDVSSLMDATPTPTERDGYCVEAAADPTFHGGWRVSVVNPNGIRTSIAVDGEAAARAKLPRMREFAALLAERDRILA